MNTVEPQVRRSSYDEDEISLYDLYRVLMNRKKLIGIIFAVVLIIAVIYILLASKVYEVKAIILPPSSGDIYLTNFDFPGSLTFKPKDIFESFTQEVISDERWNDFIRQHKKLFPHMRDDVVQENPLKLGKDTDFPGENALVSYNTTNRDTAALVFQQYLKFAEQAYVKSLIQQVKQYVKHSETGLEMEIQDERSTAKQQRLDKIVQLENDLVIAKKLGIVDNLYIHTSSKYAGNKTGVFNIFANNAKTPTYLRGSKLITAELESLKGRKSDDAYIPNLRKLQGQLMRLNQIQFTPDTFHAYRLNGEIAKPRLPVKPKKKLILVLGGLLGLFLGIFAAFIVEFISKAREQDRS